MDAWGVVVASPSAWTAKLESAARPPFGGEQGRRAASPRCAHRPSTTPPLPYRQHPRQQLPDAGAPGPAASHDARRGRNSLGRGMTPPPASPRKENDTCHWTQTLPFSIVWPNAHCTGHRYSWCPSPGNSRRIRWNAVGGDCDRGHRKVPTWDGGHQPPPSRRRQSTGSGLATAKSRNREKSRSADQSTRTPWYRQSAAIRASCTTAPCRSAGRAIRSRARR